MNGEQRVSFYGNRMDVLATVDKFRLGNKACVRLVGWPHKSADSCAETIRRLIRDYKHIKTIRVCVRKGNVYLLRKDV